MAIPLPQAPGMAFGQGMDAGSTIMNRILHNRMQQQNLDQTQQRHLDDLALRQAQDARMQEMHPLNMDYLSANIASARGEESRAQGLHPYRIQQILAQNRMSGAQINEILGREGRASALHPHQLQALIGAENRAQGTHRINQYSNAMTLGSTLQETNMKRAAFGLPPVNFQDYQQLLAQVTGEIPAQMGTMNYVPQEQPLNYAPQEQPLNITDPTSVYQNQMGINPQELQNAQMSQGSPVNALESSISPQQMQNMISQARKSPEDRAMLKYLTGIDIAAESAQEKRERDLDKESRGEAVKLAHTEINKIKNDRQKIAKGIDDAKKAIVLMTENPNEVKGWFGSPGLPGKFMSNETAMRFRRAGIKNPKFGQLETLYNTLVGGTVGQFGNARLAANYQTALASKPSFLEPYESALGKLTQSLASLEKLHEQSEELEKDYQKTIDSKGYGYTTLYGRDGSVFEVPSNYVDDYLEKSDLDLSTSPWR